MFYLASKVFWLIIQPSSLCLIAITLGLAVLAFTASRRIGLGLAFTGLAGFLVAGFSPLGNIAVLPLEERFANVQLPASGTDITGIIILGGFEDGWVSAGRGGLGVNEAAERLTEGVRLALRYPDGSREDGKRRPALFEHFEGLATRWGARVQYSFDLFRGQSSRSGDATGDSGTSSD